MTHRFRIENEDTFHLNCTKACYKCIHWNRKKKGGVHLWCPPPPFLLSFTFIKSAAAASSAYCFSGINIFNQHHTHFEVGYNELSKEAYGQRDDQVIYFHWVLPK